MRPRQKCEKCGKPVDPELSADSKKRQLPMLCGECRKDYMEQHRSDRKAEVDKRHAALRAIFAERRCVLCGKPLQWKELYYKKTPERWPQTCSPRCHGIWAKRKDTMTKEQIEARLESYIREQGRQLSYKEVITGAHIASKVLSKYHISILAIMKRVLGLQIDREQACVNGAVVPATLQDVCEELGIEASTYPELAHKIMADYRTAGFEATRARLEETVRSYIGSRGCYTGVTTVMRDLNVSFDAVREHYKLDIADINRQLGYRDTKSSWFEQTAYNELVQLFDAEQVSREHTFNDCLSSKNFPLRFDFYIPSIKLLVEIDGTQHVDQTNPYYKTETSRNDSIKDAYAREHGYELIRIPTMPRFTFLQRLHDSLLGVLKRIELLETLTGGAEGNQQPRPDEIVYLF